MNKNIDFVKVLSGLEQAREYASPEIRTIYFQPEGVLCSSGLTEKFNEQDFSDGSFWN